MDIKEINLDTKELETLISLCENPKRVLNAIGNELLNIISESFQEEKSPAGVAWTKNKLTKKEYKRKFSALYAGQEYSKKILHESGQLSKSFKAKVDSQGLIVGTNKEYAAIHQFGGKAGRGLKVTIPARPFLPIEDNRLLPKTKKEIIEIIEDYFNGKL